MNGKRYPNEEPQPQNDFLHIRRCDSSFKWPHHGVMAFDRHDNNSQSLHAEKQHGVGITKNPPTIVMRFTDELYHHDNKKEQGHVSSADQHTDERQVPKEDVGCFTEILSFVEKKADVQITWDADGDLDSKGNHDCNQNPSVIRTRCLPSGSSQAGVRESGRSGVHL